jgi:hypothetical protein
MQTLSQIDPRFENFTQAYIDMGYHPDIAVELGAQRTQEDNEVLFTIDACTDFVSAKSVVYLLEAIRLLCTGGLENAEVLRLLDMAKRGIQGVKKNKSLVPSAGN